MHVNTFQNNVPICLSAFELLLSSNILDKKKSLEASFCHFSLSEELWGKDAKLSSLQDVCKSFLQMYTP